MGRPKKFDPDVAVARAVNTFRTHGYTETSPQDLANSMGIGKGSLYNTFGSKQGLFYRSLDSYAEASLTEFKRVIEGPGPIRERVREVLRAAVDADMDDPDRCGCLIVNSAVELHQRQSLTATLVSRSFAATESVLYTALRTAQAAGEIAPDREVRALAGMVQSTMIGLRVLIKTTDDRARLHDIIDATVNSI